MSSTGPDPVLTAPTRARDGSTSPEARARPSRRRGPLVALLAVLVAAGVGVALAVTVRPDAADDGTSRASPADASTRPETERRVRSGAGRRAVPAVTGDVDGDGLGDLALAGVRRMGAGTGTAFTTYLGTGQGVGPAADAAGVDTRSVPLRGDFDGDGVEEYVAITSTVSGALELEPVDGGRPWVVTGAGFEVPPVVGDFDGDGTDDLALLGYPDGRGFDAVGVTGGEVRLALGGDDARTARAALRADLDPVADLVVPADLDGDGDDDLALLRPQGVRSGTPGSLTLTPVTSDGGRLLLGEESAPELRLAGTFARPADVDGDGTEEVALVGNTGGELVRVFGRGPTGLLTETEPWGTIGGSTGQRSVRAVGTSDVDGDGRDDLTLVRAEPDGGDVLGVDVLRGPRGGTTVPFLDLGGTGLATAKIADGAVSRPFDLAG